MDMLHRENGWTKAVGFATGIGLLYVAGSGNKFLAAKGKSTLWSNIGIAGVGVAAVVTSLYARRPYVHELLEGGGYGLTGALGLMVASSTTTIGGVAPGSVPLQFLLQAPASTSTTTGAARQRAEAAANNPSGAGAAGGISGAARERAAGAVISGFGGIGG